MEIAETRYAKARDGTHIAYKVLGSGPVDLVYLQPWFSHVEYIWEEPRYRRFLERFASFSRLILFDRRGCGLSDPLPMDHPPDMETRMDDTRAVMDEIGSQRAVVYSASESGALACLFAAMHPDRTVALVIHGSSARNAWAPDYPWGETREEHEADVAMIERGWGTEAFVREWWARFAADERLVRWLASLSRYAMSPGAAAAYERLIYEDDVRDILPAIHVPTLILHREQDSPEDNRYLAEHIAGAKYVQLPGSEHIPYLGDQDSVTKEIERFVRSVQDEEAVLDRVLATVLFTDIVGSTDAAARLGDRDWGALLERHHATVRSLLARYRGTEVDTAGDGFFATFDGPARAAKCAAAIVAGMEPIGIEVRAGLHTGEVERIAGKTGGMAVVIGSRIGAAANPSQVLALADGQGPDGGLRSHVRGRGRARAEGYPRPLAPVPGGERTRLDPGEQALPLVKGFVEHPTLGPTRTPNQDGEPLSTPLGGCASHPDLSTVAPIPHAFPRYQLPPGSTRRGQWHPPALTSR